MAKFKYLQFFDHRGDNHNFVYNETEDYWTGKIYFPRVAIDLHENTHLFILERVLTGSPLTEGQTYPVLDVQTSPTSESWKTRWKDNVAKNEMFTYQIVEEDDVPFIAKYETIEYANAIQAYTVDANGQKIVASLNSTAMQINVAFSAATEGIFERTLIIEDLSGVKPRRVAQIDLYGESVGEDERFRLMLENFGRRLDQRDALMMRDYDIKESLPDWELINEKRKEMFMAGEDIFPYMGSYRGLVNIIKFFGYQDMRIKEYWLNVDQRSEYYGKIRQIQINGLLTNDNVPFMKHPLIPTTTYRKKGEFGLFYDITKETDDVDQFGIPETSNASQFTPEEVLIKLFSLKEKLQRDYMPVNAKIVDIVGEGIYFERYVIRTWTDPLTVFPIDVSIKVDFIAEPNIGYVKDLRRFNIKSYSPGLDLPENRFTNEVNPYTMGQAYPSYAIQGLIESIEQFYVELSTFPFPYNDEKEYFNGDEPILDSPHSYYGLNSNLDKRISRVLAGCPLVFIAEIGQFTWNDMTNQAWDDMSQYTWDNLDFSNFYEIAWTIENHDETKPYYFTFRGPILEYYRLPHFLPYAGKYQVTMEIYDLCNNRSMEIKTQYVEVLNHELEVGCFARWRDFEKYTWDSTTDTWDDLAGSTWNFPVEGVSLYDSPIHEKMINWARFRNQDLAEILNQQTGVYEYYPFSTDPSAQRFGTDTLDWDSMDTTWDELYHTTWDMYDYHGEMLGGFKIYAPTIGSGIQIDDLPVFYFVDESPSIAPLDLQEAVAQLNASQNPGIVKYDWHVYQGTASPPYIQATGKFPGADSWHFITYYGSITGDGYTWKYPTWLVHQNSLQTLLATYPTINEDMLFLDAPLLDLINDTVGNLTYWENAGFKKTELPTVEYPIGERRGHLPSWAGAGSFTINDLRTFKNDFTAPIGVPLFFIHNYSEIPGKTKVRWRVTNTATGEVFIDVKNYFLIINFLEEAKYDVECWVEDSNGNESYTIRHGYVSIADRQSFAKAVPA